MSFTTGDADRVMFVDNEGEFVSPDLMIAVLGHYFVDERHWTGIVLQDIRSSKAVGEYLTPMGCRMATWKVGRAFAARKLRELDGVWGGELAGHYYFRDFFYSDSGLLASMLILRVVAAVEERRDPSRADRQDRALPEFRRDQFQDRGQEGCDGCRQRYFISKEKPTAEMDFDGYRVEFPDWWFNIRPSNTEPYLRFICEATSDALLEEKVNETRTLLVERFGAKL